jgi:ectoine hydroxylase-related dioxygenase (phytanoyl-CoA dioxygenase family)
MMDFTALKNEFDMNGFLHIRGFMDVTEVDSLAAEFDRFVAEIVPGLPRTQAMYENYDDPSTLKQIMNMEQEDSVFDKLLNDPRLIQLTSTLLNDDIVPQHVGAFIKAPFKGTLTPAHQDGYYFCLVPNEALTVWLPIGDIDASNGALCYIKGSHKGDIMPHNASGVLGFSQGLSDSDFGSGEEVVCAVEKGDCLIHHSRTIHYASGNSSERPRRSLGLIYFASKAHQDPALREAYDTSRNSQQAKLGV